MAEYPNMNGVHCSYDMHQRELLSMPAVLFFPTDICPVFSHAFPASSFGVAAAAYPQPDASGSYAIPPYSLAMTG